MARVFNFSAGPAVLPEPVLEAAAKEMLDWHGCGMSVMELSHRSSEFAQILEEAESDLRSLASIPDNYKILFLQGGASSQFAAIPLNLMRAKGSESFGIADYIITGSWSKKAWKEARRYGDARIAFSTEKEGYTRVPKQEELSLSPDADYVYMCENETIYGVKFHDLPDTKGIPLVADVSSCFLSETFDITKYGVMYGGVQKNIGPAGVVIVIAREDLISDEVPKICPTMLNWKTQADANSLYNTPPTWGIYICGLVFKWIIEQGGLKELQKRNEHKASLLYDFIDESKLFKATVAKEDRSLMNVPFVTGDGELDAKFVAEAKVAGIVNIKGHRSVGGMRASIYNAMPEEGVLALIDFMNAFEKENA